MLKAEPATLDHGRDAQTKAAIGHHLTNDQIKVLSELSTHVEKNRKLSSTRKY
jgi:hypothetical protein